MRAVLVLNVAIYWHNLPVTFLGLQTLYILFCIYSPPWDVSILDILYFYPH